MNGPPRNTSVAHSFCALRDRGRFDALGDAVLLAGWRRGKQDKGQLNVGESMFSAVMTAVWGVGQLGAVEGSKSSAVMTWRPGELANGWSMRMMVRAAPTG